MKYHRVYADDNGESLCEEVAVARSRAGFAPPAPPVDLSSSIQGANMVFLRLSAGWYGAAHPVPRRQLTVLLAERRKPASVTTRYDGYGPGSVLQCEDTCGKGHTSRVAGDEPVLIAVVQLPD